MAQTVIALTTTFVPPSSCLTDTYLYDSNPTQTFPYFYSLGPPDTSDCFPSGWGPATTAYFSPGVCPLGYSIACSNYNSIGTLTETIATCCPSGYGCLNTLGPVPGSLARAPWFTGEACSSRIRSNETITVTTTGGGTTETTVLSGVDGINAFGVIIHYQSMSSDYQSMSSDYQSMSSDYQSMSSDSRVISTIAVTSAPESVIMLTSLPTANTPSASSSSSPSTTTSIALGTTSDNTSRNTVIGVSVSLGSIGILSIIFAIWFVRRRPRASGQSRNIGGPSEEISELQASKLYPVQELPVVEERVNISELDGSGRQSKIGINLGQDSRIVQ
ncbi:hypothetical protein V8E54_004830 [Elaphomyces granulatus]